MQRLRTKILFVFASLILVWSEGVPQEKRGRWKPVAFEIESVGHEKYAVEMFAYPFAGSKSSVVKLASELNGLTGVRKNISENASVSLRFSRPVYVLVGVFNSNDQKYYKINKNAGARLVISNAATLTSLPPVNVYALKFPKGRHDVLTANSGIATILGVISVDETLPPTDAALPSGTLWDNFITEGYYDNSPLFEIIGGSDQPIIDEGMPGTENIQGGFEGGMCVKIGNTYHMFPTERAGEKGIPAYYDRVKTRIGHWTSSDAIHWTRRSTIYQASGIYAVTEDDNPMNERRGAIWSYMPVFNEKANRWYGYYLAYTVHKEIEPNHSFGRIWRCESVKEGIDGIGGPYRDIGIIMEPGLDTQLWEGRQGVDSFFPYQVGDEWLAFYGGAYPFRQREDYPRKSKKAWYVGLAKAPTPEGPWTRMDTTVNPVTSIHPFFIENPIVYKLPNGMYITVFDGGPEAWGLHLPNMIGYSLSRDGYTWSEAHYLPIETKVRKWWDVMRTPVCLIPEENDVYTILYAAIQTSKRFHPMGMVKVKLNQAVLNQMK
jgi:hypothetical protein